MMCDSDTTAVIEAMRWKMVAKETDEETQIGVAIFQKPATNEVYESSTGGGPEMCQDDNPNAAWCVDSGSRVSLKYK